MWVDPETGQKMSFPEIVIAVLVEEQGRSKEDATALVKRYPQIVMNGIMGGMQYRPTALALEMKENDDREAGKESD